MKVIFLDIDGVLNSLAWYKKRAKRIPGRSFHDRWLEDLDPTAVDILKEFVEKNDMKIVISSTWRKLLDEDELKALFLDRGWDIPMIGMTPNLTGYRGDEIQAWLDVWNSKTRGDHITHGEYLIMDDDSDFNNNQLSQFVHTLHATGLKPIHLELAQKILDDSRDECPVCNSPLNFGDKGIWCSQTQFYQGTPDDRGTCKHYVEGEQDGCT